MFWILMTLVGCGQETKKTESQSSEYYQDGHWEKIRAPKSEPIETRCYIYIASVHGPEGPVCFAPENHQGNGG